MVAIMHNKLSPKLGDNIFKFDFVREDFRIFRQISNCVFNDTVPDMSTLVHVMALRHTGDTSLLEPKRPCLLTDICVFPPSYGIQYLSILQEYDMPIAAIL